MFGAITALTAEQAGERTALILGFTSGGFLYIALVTVVPDLLQEKHGWYVFSVQSKIAQILLFWVKVQFSALSVTRGIYST